MSIQLIDSVGNRTHPPLPARLPARLRVLHPLSPIKEMNVSAPVSPIKEKLRDNFDEIAALTAELGGSMDAMFSDLMLSMQPTSANDKCTSLQNRIALKKATLQDRRTKIRSLQASPHKFAHDFEEIISDFIARLDEMTLKCADIPTMQLPSNLFYSLFSLYSSLFVVGFVLGVLIRFPRFVPSFASVSN